MDQTGECWPQRNLWLFLDPGRVPLPLTDTQRSKTLLAIVLYYGFDLKDVFNSFLQGLFSPNPPTLENHLKQFSLSHV